MTEEMHEGIIEVIVCCHDEDSPHYHDNSYLDQEQIDRFNLKEGDRVQYTVDKDDNARILGKVHIGKIIETPKD